MIYVASPYSHKDEKVRQQRHDHAAAFTVWLLNNQEWCYSPIVHCHELAKKFELPTDFEFWKNYNYAMLVRATQFYILKLEGWKESKGVAAEFEFAKKILRLPCWSWHNTEHGYYGTLV